MDVYEWATPIDWLALRSQQHMLPKFPSNRMSFIIIRLMRVDYVLGYYIIIIIIYDSAS